MRTGPLHHPLQVRPCPLNHVIHAEHQCLQRVSHVTRVELRRLLIQLRRRVRVINVECRNRNVDARRSRVDAHFVNRR